MSRPPLTPLILSRFGPLARAVALTLMVIAAPPAAATGWNLATLEQLNKEGRKGVMDLAHAWRLATLHYPDYQAALSARAAADTERRLGRAALLPQVQAGYSRSRIRGGQTRHDIFGASQNFDLDYDSSNIYIQLQQPVIDYGRYADFRRGGARADLGAAEFSQREQEIALNVTHAFLRALDAATRLQLAQQLATSLADLATAQDRLYEASEGSRIDAQETRARLAIAESDVIRAQDMFDVAMRELASMTGGEHALAALRPHFTPPPLEPSRLDEWLSRARANNPAVQVAQRQVGVAEAELKRATARHLPTLAFVLGYSKADSENLDSLSQRSNTWSAGLNARIPLFTGGYDSANRARASAELARAREELRAADERAAAEATRQYAAVAANADRISALETAVESGELSLNAAKEAYRYGVLSNVDVLRSQDRLYGALSDLAQAKIEYLAARAALWAVAGDLDEQKLRLLSDQMLDSRLGVLP